MSFIYLFVSSFYIPPRIPSDILLGLRKRSEQEKCESISESKMGVALKSERKIEKPSREIKRDNAYTKRKV